MNEVISTAKSNNCEGIEDEEKDFSKLNASLTGRILKLLLKYSDKVYTK